MKKTFQFTAILSLVIVILLASCGPGKKLTLSRSNVARLEKDSAAKVLQLERCNALVQGLNIDKASLQNQRTSLQNQREQLINQNDSVQNDLTNLSAESKLTIADQAKRLKNMQLIIQAQKDVMTKLKTSISEALMNYKTDELSVYIQDGKVYVSLAEKLLFPSGSDVVDPKGKEALKTLTKVLNATKDITVMIEGHTDNVPIKTAQFQDNWDLSTARANSILRILTIDDGFSSTAITASGRGEFHPIKTNETADGRASNRRTEIILSPDLNELYALMYQMN